MPYELNWYVKGRVTYIRIWGVIGSEDFRQLNEDLLKFLNEGTPLIHTIADDRDVETTNVKAGDMVKIFQAIRHPSMGWAITFGEANAMVKFLIYLFTQLVRVRYRRVRTMQEALDFLKSQDQTIIWTEADSAVIASS